MSPEPGFRGRSRSFWNFQDAMVGPGYMRNILCAGSRHVATDAIRILRMMRGGEGIASVAGETLLAVKRYFLFGPVRRVVRIVTAHTRHSVAAGSLALAQT